MRHTNPENETLHRQQRSIYKNQMTVIKIAERFGVLVLSHSLRFLNVKVGAENA